jgi:hypothetical protein
MPEPPWYRRTFRWGQTNLSEQDPATYDLEAWRAHWRRTRVQGLIVNAGGIVAFYPSRFELHYRAQFLGSRDLFGEIVAAARQEGLAVVARMDSNRADERFYQAHPGWFTVNADGQPGMAAGRYIACLNSPYTREYLPAVLGEIIERYHPDGVTDNSWSGPGRHWICHCAYCQEKFRAEIGLELPVALAWEDPTFHGWVRWSYTCRLEIWEQNNRVTRAAGGPDCLWMGMVHGNPFTSRLAFCDLKTVADRSELLMNDQQSRAGLGFEGNSQSGALLHGLLGWDRVVAESMAMYITGPLAFRKGSAPALEAQKWMVSGFAGGISPWWHHVGAYQEDRRQFRTAEALMQWHAANEDVLNHRQPVAEVGVLWSQDNLDFYGRDQVERRVGEPWRGITLALTKARLLHLPVHAEHVGREAARYGLCLLILPDLAVLSTAQCQAVRQFVETGGSLVATGRSSLLDEDGRPRADFALGDLFGAQYTGEIVEEEAEEREANWQLGLRHTYLRLEANLSRHAILSGFEETNILPFGGVLQGVASLPGSESLATFIPSFPIYPPETSWMRQPSSDRPVIVARQHPSGGRVVYFAGDIDRCYGRYGLPDHGRLLINAIRWAIQQESPLQVTGPGYVDCRLYKQEGRLILHLVNLSGCYTPGYLEEHLPVGPLQIAIRLERGQAPQRAVRRVEGGELALIVESGTARFEIARLVDHELIVVE